MAFEEAANDVMALLPRAPQRPHTVISVSLKKGAKVSVDGYGWPFHNPHQPQMEKWVNEDAEIFPSVSLLAFLKGSKFTFVVPDNVNMAAKMFNEAALVPFDYPYGEDHSWDLGRYTSLVEKTKSCEKFMAAP